jgi:ribonuclease D
MDARAPSVPDPIVEQVKLTRAMARFAADEFVAVDTEFMRETTFWPKLCLIQISGASGDTLIDPQADGLDLKPFFDLMANTRVVKVFHAARQDIEIIYQLGGLIPHPLFDSQIAAMVCGFGDAVGYENLIRALLKRRMDKSSRFTDWSRRPLKPQQLAYALSDVTHLKDAYPMLKAKLEETGRTGWVSEEMAILENPETYKADPARAWRRLKYSPRSKRALGVFMAVAAWREREAQNRDVPRNRVMRDDALRELATQQPKSTADLEGLRAVPKGFARSSRAQGLLDAVTKGRQMAEADIPELAPDNRSGRDVSPIVEMLKVLLKIVSSEHDVAPKLIASTADLEAIARHKHADVRALGGWRRELFGKPALDLKRGHLSLALEDGRPVLERRQKSDRSNND